MWARPQSAPCQVVAGSPLQPPMVLFHRLGSRWINPLHRGKEAKVGREKRKCLPTSLSSGRGGVGVKEGQSRMYSPSSRPYLAQSRRTPIWRLRLRQLPFGEKEGTRPRNSASFCTFACSEWERSRDSQLGRSHGFAAGVDWAFARPSGLVLPSLPSSCQSGVGRTMLDIGGWRTGFTPDSAKRC